MFRTPIAQRLFIAAALLAGAAQAGQRPDLPWPVTDADYFDNGNPPAAMVELGRFLYWDKELSGNRNISCATCHHVLAGTGDGLALPVGEGGRGLGIARGNGIDGDRIHERVPRNAPPVYNLGAYAFSVMFHDGRIEADPMEPSGFLNPAGDALPEGLDNALAAQAMFPVTSAAEMAGQPGENPIADAVADGNLAGVDGVWEQLAERLRSIDAYVDLFIEAYRDVAVAEDITFVHAANAIAAYEATAFRADDSPFDRFLHDDRRAMSPAARRGMRLFYGRAGCSDCHSGPFQTDLQFHAIAMPQVGPGKGDGLNGNDDFGRERVSGDPADRYRFRTPSLRNVALTGPWGHAGAYDDLRGVVEHHLDPVAGLADYDPRQLVLPTAGASLDAIDLIIHDDLASQAAIAAANELSPTRLRARQVDDLMAFLFALTDEHSLDLRASVPRGVPSGLPLAD